MVRTELNKMKKDIFDLSIKEFEEKVDKIVNNITAEELLKELKENGLQIK